MKKELEKHNIKVINSLENIFFERDGVIVDKFCPKCGRILFCEKDFCKCGYFIKAGKNSAAWTIFLTSAFSGLILFIALFMIIQVHTKKISEKLNLDKINFSSVSPMDVQVLTSLKNTPYRNYIQNIYVKPRQENTIVVIIKPSVWDELKESEKDNMMNLISKNWDNIYHSKYPDSKEKTIAYFGNSK